MTFWSSGMPEGGGVGMIDRGHKLTFRSNVKYLIVWLWCGSISVKTHHTVHLYSVSSTVSKLYLKKTNV